MTDRHAADPADLTDREVFAVLDMVVAGFTTPGTPEGTVDQIDALNALLRERGHTPQPLAAPDQREALVATARGALDLLLRTPETAPTTATEVTDPPRQENATVADFAGYALVLTACIVLLQVAGHTTFDKKSAGRWRISYDPSREAPLDKILLEIAKLLSALRNGG